MADLEKTVKIIFGGEDRSLSSAVKGVDAEMVKLQLSVDNITDPLSKAGSAIMKVDAALSAMVVGGIALAIRESSNFNKEFALISTSVDATGSDLDQYRQHILDYSTTSVKSISDINAALYTAAQAGVQWGDSLDFISKSEQLAVANNANLNTTVDLLTGTMNAYGYSVKDVGHLNDVFFQSTLIGKQTIDELGQSMGQVVGIAANAGVSFEELQAAIATLTAKGMNTSDAITAVKAAITTIISPSVEASKAAQSLGLNFSASSLKAEGFSGMMEKIMAATGGSTDKMTQLFNEVRAMNGVMQLTGDGMTFFRNALDEIAASTGASEEAYKKMVATFANQSQMIVNTAKTLLIEVGERLEPLAGGIAASLATLMTGIKSSIDKGAFDGVFAVFDDMAGQLADSMKKAAQSMPDAMAKIDTSKLVEAMRNAGDAIAKVFGGSTSADIADNINTIIDTIASLISTTQGIVEVFVPIAAVIREMIQAFNSLDSSTKEFMGNLMGFSMAYKFFGPISISLIALGADADAAGRIFTFFFASLENGFNVIKVIVYAVATAFFELATGATKFLDMIPGLDFSKEVAANEKTLDSLKNKLSGAGDALMLSTAKVVDAWNETNESADRATGKVSNFQKAVDGITPQKTTELTVKVDQSALETEKKKIESALSTAKKINLDVEADESSIEQAYGMVIKRFPDGSVRIVQIDAQADAAKLEEAKKKIEKEIPAEKLMEIQANVDIARIKEQSAIIQSSIEWKAKVDIAQIESATKKIEVMFQSIDNTISSTGNVLSDLFGSLTESGGTGFSSAIEDQIRRENDYRDEALRIQKELINAEIKEIDARTKLMNEGKDIGIRVSADGLAPHLEAIWFEVLSAIQVRATAEGIKMLV